MYEPLSSLFYLVCAIIHLIIVQYSSVGNYQKINIFDDLLIFSWF